MTLVIDLPEEKTRLLSQEATRRGVTAQDYARSAVETTLEHDTKETFPAREHSILELEGLGAEIWRDTHGKSLNASEYVRELRDEWDGRE